MGINSNYNFFFKCKNVRWGRRIELTRVRKGETFLTIRKKRIKVEKRQKKKGGKKAKERGEKKRRGKEGKRKG